MFYAICKQEGLKYLLFANEGFAVLKFKIYRFAECKQNKDRGKNQNTSQVSSKL